MKCDGIHAYKNSNGVECQNEAEWKIESCFGITNHCTECRDIINEMSLLPPLFESLEVPNMFYDILKKDEEQLK